MVRIKIEADETVGAGAAGHIKRTALRLFAERGVDGVTVREIATAAGQKNHGAVGYHFGSKEALVRAIVKDGAIELDRLRNAMVDKLEAAGGPAGVRDIIAILIQSVLALPNEHYVRFITMFAMTHRDLMLDAIDPEWNRAYGRCLDHLRCLLPHLPAGLQSQRFVFMGASLSAILSARERALADDSRHTLWTSQESLDHYAQMLAAMLEAPAGLAEQSAAVLDTDGPGEPHPFGLVG
jgi:AcrR family transcriptional regulator